MSVISMVGFITISINKKKLEKFLSLFVAMASGTLLGGAFFHMLPHALTQDTNTLRTMVLLLVGFLLMYALELIIHWHHCSSGQRSEAKPQGVMILLADGIHNFIGGIGIGASFVADVKLGISLWLIALLHEIPQEIGDHAILLDSGWEVQRALAFNFVSSLTFLLGMLIVYALNTQLSVHYLIPFAAGNFIYIAASDLIPEVKEHPRLKVALLHLAAFTLGLALLISPKILEHNH